jgi:hypothetical protein
MDTERFILAKDLKLDAEDISIPVLDEKEKGTLVSHVEITRHIQEIEQLFQLFRFNLKNLLHYYTLKNSDRIVRNFPFDFQVDDGIAINALVINFISSGKTLIESIEVCLKESDCADAAVYAAFKAAHLSRIYDDSFSYRLLLRMRDFAQHCHLPVSIYHDNTCCFDVEQILCTPHFSHNPALKKQLEDIRDEIHDKYGNNARITFTASIAEFNLQVTKLYLVFWDAIEPLLQASSNAVSALLLARPDIVTRSEGPLNGLILYEVDEVQVHAFHVDDDPLLTFACYKQQAAEILLEEEIEFNDFKKSLKFVRPTSN